MKICERVKAGLHRNDERKNSEKYLRDEILDVLKTNASFALRTDIHQSLAEVCHGDVRKGRLYFNIELVRDDQGKLDSALKSLRREIRRLKRRR